MSVDVLAAGRARRALRRRGALTTLAVLVLGTFLVTLMVGQTFYPPLDVLRVIAGETVPGASFTVGELRLPRAMLAVLAGAAFALGGVTFQTMLRNPLASPDIIGITHGASAAAVFGITVLSVSGALISFVAVVAALATAMLIYVLSFKDGVVGTRLILIGIGIAAMLQSVVSYLLVRAATWDLPAAMRWITGSLNGATWSEVVTLLAAVIAFGVLLLSQSRRLDLLQLGDDTASALGVRVERTRVLVIIAAVGLIAFATAAAGPIAFVAFLSGPIAARLVGPTGSLLVPAALVGALLVLVADLAGQFALGARYPVGVVTGVLGAPYLVYLLIRTNRAGGSL
ncbi:iron ABC transporter permease [Aeromicrobium camelliae]|uniref:Iron ABC transporter permease n=1 Tax=Aeromicrobium camelliae TaxID=1538144 RepID=A0A3N6W5U4_9ACTN|nr:iron chelate uptake ABC transporter family permease subunit [Aeromicrobium camelliae]RQN02890.1 iron ABC transporter permease [Aeromicrobium camelliae]